jgi:hypothetical protein
MLVKSMLVPDVDATAVPDVIAPPWMVLLVSVCVASVPTKVVVASGSVSVLLVAVMGAAMVSVPAPLPLLVIAIALIFIP